MADDFDRLRAEMRAEARDAIADKLMAMGGLVVADLQELRRDAHSLKGMAAAFGLTGVAIIAHRLEDYLAVSSAAPELQLFIDRAQEILDGDDQGEACDLAEIVRRLPTPVAATFDPAEVEVREVEIMLVAPRVAATRYVADQLRACGYRLVLVAKAAEAFDFAVKSQPDLVIVSAVLERFDGIDLICALNAMPSTAAIPVALLTSFEDGDLHLKNLPLGVPVLHKSPTFADDLSSALSQLGII